MTNRHYLPVYRADGYERQYTLYVVYLDDDDQLKAWDDNLHVAPIGATLSELTHDLDRMRGDAGRWFPVNLKDLKAGMKIHRVSKGEG